MEERSLSLRPSGTLPGHPASQNNLADILERVLDKGIVIAGDIQINLLEVELLTIKLRLLIASVDRAREMGINWWESDTTLQSLGPGEDVEPSRLDAQNRELGGRASFAARRAALLEPALSQRGTETPVRPRTRSAAPEPRAPIKPARVE